MRRPPSKYPEYRLDALLKRKADQGVKIYVVVYKVFRRYKCSYNRTWLLKGIVGS